MASSIIMPRMTHDMKTGLLIRWLRKEGDAIEVGTPLFEVETDKAISEVTAEVSGVLGRLYFAEGDEVPVGALMAYILGKSEQEPDLTIHPLGKESGEKKDVVAEIPLETSRKPQAIGKGNLPEIIASPIARRMARENRIELVSVAGSGPRGRIVESDIKAYMMQHKVEDRGNTIDLKVPFESDNLTKVQEVSPIHTSESHAYTPTYVLEDDVDMSQVIRLRELVLEKKKKALSLTAIFVKVVARALAIHPRLNAAFIEDEIRCYKDINVGLATATPEGLQVLVIRNANILSLPEIQSKIDVVQQDVSQGKLPLEFIGGATFTLSNLGVYGVSRFKAIINPPEGAILAVGAIKEKPWRLSSGELGLAPVMTLCLSVDHRVIAESDAARFLSDLVNYLEKPYLLL